MRRRPAPCQCDPGTFSCWTLNATASLLDARAPTRRTFHVEHLDAAAGRHARSTPLLSKAVSQLSRLGRSRGGVAGTEPQRVSRETLTGSTGRAYRSCGRVDNLRITGRGAPGKRSALGGEYRPSRPWPRFGMSSSRHARAGSRDFERAWTMWCAEAPSLSSQYNVSGARRSVRGLGGRGHRLRQPEGRSREDHDRGQPRFLPGSGRPQGPPRRHGPSGQRHERRRESTRTPSTASVYDVLLGETDIMRCRAGRRASTISRCCLRIAAWQGPRSNWCPILVASAGSKQVLDGAGEQYDFILLDCPPSLGLLTVNALTAAEQRADPAAVRVLRAGGPQPTDGDHRPHPRPPQPRACRSRASCLTMHDGRTSLSADVTSEVRRHLGSQVFDAVVPRSVRLAEAPSYGQPIARVQSRLTRSSGVSGHHGRVACAERAAAR